MIFLKKSIFLSTMLLLFTSCEGPKKAESEKNERPNILFIMSDDHAYQAISAYQNHLIEISKII